MAHYPDAEQERRFSKEKLHRAVTQVFIASRMNPADASLLTETLVDADVHGIHSHGVMRVLDYVGRLSDPAEVTHIPGIRGGVNPHGRPRIERDSGAMVRVDGDNAIGQVACAFATNAVIQRARYTGLAFAAVGNSNHCAAMYWYVQKMLDEDTIGIASTNTLPTMAPWGGADRIVGMNPLALGLPAGRYRAFLVDAAFAASARGKIVVYGQKGAPLEEGWAYDQDGLPTTDPLAALDGLIQPVGGYKGINVAMALGMLSTLMSGAGYGTRLGDLDEGPVAARDGHFVMAMNVAALVELDVFKAEMDAVIAEAHQSRKAPGVERIYVAGEMEYETAERYARDAVPLNEQTLADLAATAAVLKTDANERLLAHPL